MSYRRLFLSTVLTTVLVVSAGLVSGSDAQAFADPLVTSSAKMVEFSAGGAGPVDVAATPNGSVWVALYDDKKVVRLDASGKVLVSVGLTGRPTTVSSNAWGDVWVSEPSSNLIAYVSASGAVQEVALSSPGSAPTQVYDNENAVLIAESTTGHVGRLDRSTATVTDLPFTGGSSPRTITGIGDQVWVIDDKGATWVLDAGGEHPVPVDIRGMALLELTELNAGTVRGISATNEGIFSFSRSATDFQSGRILGGRQDITGLASIDGVTWFADAGTNTIGWVLGSQRSDYPVSSVDSGLSGMAVTEGRYIWSAEQKTGKVVRIDATFPDVVRIGGTDRYELGVNISKAGDYGASDHTVFVVSGETFADALSAGPIAAAHTAPILLTTRAALPESTRGELLRLAPRHVVVVGGPASVSPTVFDSIKAAVPAATVDRIGGVDRYAVSRALLTGDLARDNSPTLYVADGRNYPDALSSTAAAAHLSSAVLLVNGSAGSLSSEEMAIIATFAGSGKSVRIVGGPNSVSVGIELQIRTMATARRLGGADRYEVSQAIVRDAFGSTALSLVYLASGASFPDALAGGVGAALNGAPVLLAHPDCVPEPVLAQIATGHTRKVTLYGGPLTLGPEVETLTACG